jgi:methionyl-tRNA formyltransferase
MNIVYMGSGEFGLDCLDALAGSEHKLSLVVTQKAKRAGRGQKERPTAAANWAKDQHLTCLEVENVNEQAVFEKIAALNPDLIIVIAFGQKISNQLINLPSKGMINVHSSLLPRYRGAAPVNWAIIHGEQKTGISIITVVEKMDAGNILGQAELQIKENETAGQLHNRLAQLAPSLLLDTVEKIEKGTAQYTPQEDSKATLAPKLKKTDGYLDFNDSAENLKRRIFGLWPWPGASALYVPKETNKKIRVTLANTECIETENSPKMQPGMFDDKLNIICGTNALKIIKIKPAGSKIMDFTAFVNGHRTKSGDRLEKINP